jgi:hypothetical protein
MAALKDATIWSTLPPGATARGRDNYALKGVLRTKPGRADSPPTACMSCSDKIAFWNAVGFQGALLAQFLAEPLYIERIVVGDVPLDLQLAVHGDCERAFWSRLGGCESKRNTLSCFYQDRSDNYVLQRYLLRSSCIAPKYTSHLIASYTLSCP